MKLLKVTIMVLALSISGCATTSSQSPKQAAIKSGQLFKFQESHFAWIPAGRGLSGGLANIFAGSIGTDSPQVASLVKIMNPAKTKIVRIGVSGPNSSFTSSIIIAALKSTQGKLPNLHLAFIGSREHKNEVRSAVKEKGANFLFSDTNSN